MRQSTWVGVGVEMGPDAFLWKPDIKQDKIAC